jgi:hypothetical protein
MGVYCAKAMPDGRDHPEKLSGEYQLLRPIMLISLSLFISVSRERQHMHRAVPLWLNEKYSACTKCVGRDARLFLNL